jgi:hypothetical protein
MRHEKFYKIKRRDARGKTFGCSEKNLPMEAMRKAERIQGRGGKILIRLKPALQSALSARAQKNNRSITQGRKPSICLKPTSLRI